MAGLRACLRVRAAGSLSRHPGLRWPRTVAADRGCHGRGTATPAGRHSGTTFPGSGKRTHVRIPALHRSLGNARFGLRAMAERKAVFGAPMGARRSRRALHSVLRTTDRGAADAHLDLDGTGDLRGIESEGG